MIIVDCVSLGIAEIIVDGPIVLCNEEGARVLVGTSELCFPEDDIRTEYCGVLAGNFWTVLKMEG
jgi:DNA-directed RNA polymerase subunit E'/Rpb7